MPWSPRSGEREYAETESRRREYHPTEGPRRHTAGRGGARKAGTDIGWDQVARLMRAEGLVGMTRPPKARYARSRA